MAVDPRLECLPEHEGPAFRTWQLILQTTIGKVIQTPPLAAFQFDNPTGSDMKKSKSFNPTGDFIPLNNETLNETTNSKAPYKSNTEKHLKRKTSRNSDSSSCSSKDEEDKHKIGISPWKTGEKYPENAYGLHLEIIDFYKYMSPLPEEEIMRKDVVQRMTDLIVSIWPAAKVEVFGSFRTNLYLPSSDIDLAVFGKWEKLPLFTLEKALISKDISEPASIKVLDKATVPIIKLTDKKSRIRVDISFNTETSIQSAEMVKSYIKEYKTLPYLFLTLKHFLVQRDLNEVFTGGISSYCLMLLVISFLQRQPRSDVRQDPVNLGVLLMEFFELYGRNFNYQKIGIKIKNGGSYISKEQMAKELGNGEYPALLCIEDPVTLGSDIGRSSYRILQVKETFEYAFNIVDSALRNKYYFKVNPNSTYLSRIISIPQELCDYRRWIQKIYQRVLFIPKPLPSPVYQTGVMPSQYQGNGRPALLPTPPSPFSPQLSVISPPFSLYTTNSGNLPYSPVGFFPNSPIMSQQHIILTNDSTRNNAIIHASQANRLPNLHIPPPSNTTSPRLGQIAYILPSVFSPPQVEQIMHKPMTPVFSPVKTATTKSSDSSNLLIPVTYQGSNSHITSSVNFKKGQNVYKKDTNFRSNFVNTGQKNVQNTPPMVNTAESIRIESSVGSVDGIHKQLPRKGLREEEPVVSHLIQDESDSPYETLNMEDSVIEISTPTKQCTNHEETILTESSDDAMYSTKHPDGVQTKEHPEIYLISSDDD